MPVTVSSPTPGGGTTATMAFGVLESGLTSLDTLTLPAYDLLYEPTSGILFASIAGTGGAQHQQPHEDQSPDHNDRHLGVRGERTETDRALR